VRHPDGGQVQDRTQVEGEPRTAGMVAPSRVHQQDVQAQRQHSNRALEQRPLPQREQTRLVGRSRGALNDHCLVVGRRRSPGPITGLAGPDGPRGKHTKQLPTTFSSPGVHGIGVATARRACSSISAAAGSGQTISR
jgi:hypothetical protein